MPTSRISATRWSESPQAWTRLAVCVAFGTIGGAGMWSVPVTLSAVQAEFAVARGDASLPYTLAMLGFAFGGVLMGRLADRFGILVPAALGAAMLGLGFVAAGFAPNLLVFALIYGAIGTGTSATFGPLMADVSRWFTLRRGLAVAVAAAGNYLAGTIWPPVVQQLVAAQGWRAAHIAIGLFCLIATLPLIWMLRRQPPDHVAATASAVTPAPLPISGAALQVLLCIAGVACCVAMAMPQVHIVAYCGDLGYGVARGAEMLSLMLGFGIVSRVASGFIADRIGGVGTLMIGSVLQGLALLLYLVFDGLISLYVISAMFGLFQGGIVPSYAVIVREYFPAREVGTRVGVVLMATLIGMALGGWMSGAIFDWSGSYRAAFANGLAWNLLNVTIAAWLLTRGRRRIAMA